MSELPKPLIKRKSYVNQYQPLPNRLSRSQTSFKYKMSWMLPSGPRMPPGFNQTTHQREPPPDPPGPYPPKPPDEYPVKLSLKLEAEDKDTDLARICSDPLHELPQLVKVGERFAVEGNDMKLEKGESLLLLFIAELPRVHAVETSGNEVWLPVHAEQVYERLPLDPRLDDKLYTGATALMNAKPMPSVVRVLEGYGSDDYTECVDQEDIIQISHIEEKSKRHDKQKVLIAQNQIGHRLELHKDMECAYFTSMMSALFLHMSELIGLEFPQRVRVVEETNFERRKPKEEKVFKLLSFKKDLQVIATRTKKPGLLSIPITVPLALSSTAFKEKTIQSCLPHLFPAVNLTWGIGEFGRPELAPQLREIWKPLPEPLRTWIESYEGKDCACQVAKVSKEDLVRDLKELTNYNKDLSNRIAFLGQAERPFIPSRDKPHAPPRPIKPASFRVTLPPKPKPVVKPAKSPKPKFHSFAAFEGKGKKIPKTEPEKRTVSTDGYEVPDLFEDSDNEENCDYEVVPDLKDGKTAENKTMQETCQELKMILQQKEKTISKLKEENEGLKEKCKKLEQEKDNIRLSNFKNVDEINRLQGEIDQLLSRNDRDIYDVIRPTARPLPVLPQSPDAVIYNTPDSLLVEKALLSRTDMEGVADILRQLGLSRYVDKFKEEEVNGALLITLDETVLKEDLGMTGLHARKLLLEIKKNTK